MDQLTKIKQVEGKILERIASQRWGDMTLVFNDGSFLNLEVERGDEYDHVVVSDEPLNHDQLYKAGLIDVTERDRRAIEYRREREAIQEAAERATYERLRLKFG